MILMNVPFTLPYWLAMEVNSDGEMAPRQAITSVGYAYHAKTVQANGITETEIELTNNAYLTAKNSAGTGTVNVIKVNANNFVVVPDGTETATNAAPTSDNALVNKKYVDDHTGMGRDVFLEDGIFTVPAGVSMVYLTMVGGGGGGEAENGQTPAGGGAGGAYINYPFAVIGGNSYLVTIGTGGAGGAGSYGADGANGGVTSFDSVSIAGGQGGGVRGDGLGGYGGLLARDANQSIGGEAGINSGNGADGVQNTYHGGGGASIFGNGGNAGNPGVAGSLYGGGGGAGGPGSPAASGGAGANGICIVMY